MSVVRSQAKALTDTRALYAVGSILFILAVIYAYLVIGIILSVVLRQELEVAIKEKHSSMAYLESSYLAKGQSITEDFARERGFMPLDAEEFASKQKFSHAITSGAR
jgi:hypothetical protein